MTIVFVKSEISLVSCLLELNTVSTMGMHVFLCSQLAKFLSIINLIFIHI